MRKNLFAILSLTILIALLSSTLVSAESAVTQSGEAKSVTSTLPTIDGQIDEVWANANSHNIDIVKVGEDTGVKSYFKVLWTPSTLYLLYVVPDKTPNQDAVDNYKRDTIEVPIDFSNARTEAYENDDQINMTFFANGDPMVFGQTGNGNVTEDAITWAVTESADGYVYEIAIACDKFGVTLSADKMIGIDAQVNDNANGDGERTACYAWNDDGDQVWQNPTYMGEMKLVSASADIVEAPAEASLVPDPAPVEAAPAPEAAAAPAPAPVAVAVQPAPATSDTVVFSAIFAVLAASAYVTFKKARATK